MTPIEHTLDAISRADANVHIYTIWNVVVLFVPQDDDTRLALVERLGDALAPRWRTLR